MTSEDLKAFRAKYCLTMGQAARATSVPKLTWRQIEHGKLPVPPSLVISLTFAEKEINRLLKHLERYCQYCRREVVKSKARNPGPMHRCPYCNRISTMSRKTIMNQALPDKETKLTIDQRRRQLLDKLGYKVKL